MSETPNNPHLLSLVYGLPVEQTDKVVVYSAFTGCGKTRGLCRWLADNYRSRITEKSKGSQYIIAFKEVRLLAEFATDLYEMVRVRSKSEVSNLHRYFEFVFDPDNEKTLNKLQETSEGNAKVVSIINFLKNTTASTSLCKKRMGDIHKAKVVLTTHESLLRLGVVGALKGKTIVIDEEPSNFYQVHELADNEDIEDHKKSFLYDADTIDSSKRESRRIGRFIKAKLWKSSGLYQGVVGCVNHFSHSYHSSYHKGDFTPLNSKVSVGAPEQVPHTGNDGGSDVISSGTKKVINNTHREHSQEVLKHSDTPPSNLANQPSTEKPNNTIRFYVSYADFASWGARSVSILSACPQGTSIALLDQLGGNTFQYIECKDSISRKNSVRARATMEFSGIHVSCARSATNTKPARVLLECMLKLAEEYHGLCYAICHGWMERSFQLAGIPTVKLGQTGMNLLNDKTVILVSGMAFMDPKGHAIEQCIFGEDFSKRERWVLASALGQSVMRSRLRGSHSEKVSIVYSDLRVAEAWKLFLSPSPTTEPIQLSS